MVKPSPTLDFTDDPLPFTLLDQDPAQPSIISSSPEDKVPEEKRFRHHSGQAQKQENLESEQSETEDVEVRFMIRGVEKRSREKFLEFVLSPTRAMPCQTLLLPATGESSALLLVAFPCPSGEIIPPICFLCATMHFIVLTC